MLRSPHVRAGVLNIDTTAAYRHTGIVEGDHVGHQGRDPLKPLLSEDAV
jgi:hypothetical protein